jgi:violaxanthin de-epoxidase
MDLYENAQLRAFSECAMTASGCLPPLPADEPARARFGAAFERVSRAPPELPRSADLLKGKWLIALGLNPAFDTFPCEVHEFKADPDGKLIRAQFRYRVVRDDGSSFERSYNKLLDTPDPERPYLLRLRPTPPYLAYADQWLLLGGQPSHPTDPWFAILYYGTNAAWSGYGGASVYTRSGRPPTAPDAVRALDAALAKGGMRRSELTTVDNSCTP